MLHVRGGERQKTFLRGRKEGNCRAEDLGDLNNPQREDSIYTIRVIGKRRDHRPLVPGEVKPNVPRKVS